MPRKYRGFKMTRVRLPLCNTCGGPLTTITGSNQCPSCDAKVDFTWWSTWMKKAYSDAHAVAQRVRCPDCGSWVVLLSENFSPSGKLICQDCTARVLDMSCPNCWDWHHDTVGFYDCEGFNKKQEESVLFRRATVTRSRNATNFIRQLGARCKRETGWDFPQTSPELFKGEQVAVLVLFDSTNWPRVVGFVTLSGKPTYSSDEDASECRSPYMIADLYVLPEERGKGNAVKLLREMRRRYPNIAEDGRFNYSAPATDGGMGALCAAFSELTPAPV